MSPRILANAIAGSPEMSYRRSSHLFTRIPSIVSTYVEKDKDGKDELKFNLSTRAERVEFELLRFVKQLVGKYRGQPEELKSHRTLFQFSDKWVDHLRESSPAAQFLRDNKPAFLQSVARIEKRNIKNPEAEPYAIVRLFWYLLRNKSPEQQLLHELRELKY